MIKIDKNFPIPDDHRKSSNRYPFINMDIGDSFFVDNKTPQQFSNVRNYWANKLKRKFIARAECNGCRVWRIE